MMILILNWRDTKHPLAGGAELSTHEHAKAWVRAGHSVIQFSSTYCGAKKTEEIDGVKVIRRGNHYTVHLFALLYYIKNLRGKIQLIVDEFHFIPFFTPLYATCKKVAFIHETAGKIWFKNQFFPINIIGFLIEPFLFNFYKKLPFITVSGSTKKDLMRFGISEKNITIIHNGFSLRKSSNNKEKSPIVVYLGRLAKDKGPEDAVKAFYETQREFPSCKLWIIGREEKKGLEDYLMKLVRRIGIEEKVIFFGFVTEEEKFDLLKKAWILINPSIKEGWGITVIEAASQGTPTVAYNNSGLRDSIQNEKTGFLVNERRPRMLAEKINLLIKNKTLCDRLSRNCIEWSNRFRWEKAVNASLKLIEGL